MQIDPTALQNADYSKVIPSLVDRLNQLDSFSKQTEPIGINFLQNLPHIPTENPLANTKSQLAIGKSNQEDWQQGMQYLSQILGLQQSDINSQRQTAMDLLNLNASQAEADKKANPNVQDLGTSEKSKVADYTAFLKDLGGLSSQMPSDSGFFSDLLNQATGPLTNLVHGEYGPSGQLRSDLNTLEQKIKNKYYGSALTDTEVQQARKWIPASGKQETKNVKNINSIYNSKVNELKTLLKTNGVSDANIQAYMAANGISDTAPAGVSSQTTNNTLDATDEALINKYKNK